MPSFAPVETESARLRHLLYFAEAEGGSDPRLIRVIGRTDVGLALLEAWHTALFGGLLPHRIKELVRLRLSTIDTSCSRRGRKEGITDQILQAMPDYEHSVLFNPRERMALLYADWFAAEDVDREEAFDDLRAHFTDEEIIELGKFCALVVGVDRFARALGLS